jgi:putative MATE family efflux protein
MLLGMIRSGQPMSNTDKLRLTLLLSVPAILAQLSSVMMQYIDATMVGRMGAGASASIGLVSTCTWLFGGFCMACGSGFSVQIAHLFGAGDYKEARSVLRHALLTGIAFSIALGLIGVALSFPLPRWLGGEGDICNDASWYFLIFSAFVPAMQLQLMGASILASSGNMKVPAALEVLMCLMDVVFNYIFIYVLDMGVKGAALGTGLAEVVTAGLMMYFLLVRSKELNLRQEREKFKASPRIYSNALKISGPMAFQNILMRGAYIAGTVLVAPLGTVAIAANTLAVTAESFCYMPGYGIADACTTLVGQSLGAGRKDLAKSFARFSTGVAMVIVVVLSTLLYILAPAIMSMLTPDPEVIALGTRVLRIVVFAELMYTASIVCDGALIGGGDTMMASTLNLASMWLFRIVPALFLTPVYGLVGYWAVMTVELNIRGVIFILRVRGNKWMHSFDVTQEALP